MCLVLLVIAGQAGNDGRVEVPGVFVIRNQNLNPVGAFCLHREERTHQSGADASGWMGEVEFQDGVEIPGQTGHVDVEGEQEIFFDLDCGVEGDRELREGLVWFGLWGVFVAQLGESVIGTDEEVVTADVGVRVVWEPFGWYLSGYGRPFQLFVVFEAFPCLDGSFVDCCIGELCRGSLKDCRGLCLPVAFSVTVVEGDVSHRSPAVLKQYVWNV